jgi:hypothetical protein
LSNLKEFLKERTNSSSINFERFDENLNVTTYKERFKNISEFKIKEKRGVIKIIKSITYR